MWWWGSCEIHFVSDHHFLINKPFTRHNHQSRGVPLTSSLLALAKPLVRFKALARHSNGTERFVTTKKDKQMKNHSQRHLETRPPTRWSAHLHLDEQFTFYIPLIGRIWIRTLTQIESPCSRHRTDSSTSFYQTRTPPSLLDISWDTKGLVPSLSMVKNHWKNPHIRIRIRIFTKIKSCCHWPVTHEHKTCQNDCLKTVDKNLETKR